MKFTLNIWAILIIANTISGYDQITYGNKRQGKPPEKEILALYRNNLANDNIPEGAIELKLKYIIPLENEVDEKEIYFKNVFYINRDPRGHIFASDGVLCAVYEFDKNGRLYAKFTKRGQGPGEMQFPISVLFYKDQLAVLDGRQLRLSYYDREWNYQRSLPLFKSYIPFGIDSKGDIYCEDLTKEALIVVLDENGNMKKAFGEPKSPQKMKSALNSTVSIVTPSGSVWVCFRALGIVREYSVEGEMRKEIDMQNQASKYMKKLIKENYEQEKKGIMGFNGIISSITFNNEDIFISIGGILNPIYQINKDGNIKNIFYIKPQYGLWHECHIVTIDDNKKETFYMLRKGNGELSIGVYGRE